MPKGENGVLYTSLLPDGALAELVFHWGMLSPLPSKPAVLSHLRVDLTETLRILRVDLAALDVDEHQYLSTHYDAMQKIGAAVAFLGCDGLIVPSARWSDENLVIFTENLKGMDTLSIEETKEVDWQKWGRENNLLD